MKGELDLYTADALREEVAGATTSRLAIDVSQVSFIDSSGLGALVAAMKHVMEAGGSLVIVTAEDSPTERLLSLTGLDRIMPIARTQADLSGMP